MRVLPPQVSDALTVAGFRVGWAALRLMPERAAYAMFDRAADLTVARGGAARLRSNYARVRPELDEDALDALVRDGMRRCLRYYCEAFRLPVLTPDDVLERVRVEGDGPVREVIDGGGSVVAFLGHLGNWDLAGRLGHRAPGAGHHRGRAAEARGGLRGVPRVPRVARHDDHPAHRWGQPVPGAARGLPPAAASSRCSPTATSPPAASQVDFCGHPARMAFGPAALALAERRPLHPVSIRHERRGRGWGIVITFHPAVDVPEAGTTRERATAMTQACADVLGAAVREHTADWHMLQRVFLDDLDEDRLARRRGDAVGEGSR